jgi:protein tyrosine/serine phosphatase
MSVRALLRALGVAIVAIALVAGISEIRDAFASTDEKLELAGVENFGRLNARLYRGGQPTVAGYESLKELGIDTVVRLSTGDEYIERERVRVESLGIRFVSLPWRAEELPTPAQVASFLALFRDQPARTIFVHCRKGMDRTGVMIALYRIAVDHFAPDRAISEMKAFHYRYLFHPQLQRFVEAFAPLPDAAGVRSSSETAFVMLQPPTF